MIWVDSSQTKETALVGLTIRNAEDCIVPNGRFRLLNTYVTGCTDGVDYETRSGGLIRHSTFSGNSDDGKTDETYEAATLHEPIALIENDFEGNDRDVTCGGL